MTNKAFSYINIGAGVVASILHAFDDAFAVFNIDNPGDAYNFPTVEKDSFLAKFRICTLVQHASSFMIYDEIYRDDERKRTLMRISLGGLIAGEAYLFCRSWTRIEDNAANVAHISFFRDLFIPFSKVAFAVFLFTDIGKREGDLRGYMIADGIEHAIAVLDLRPVRNTIARNPKTGLIVAGTKAVTRLTILGFKTYYTIVL